MGLKQALRSGLPTVVFRQLARHYIRVSAWKNGVKLRRSRGLIDVVQGRRTIRLSDHHLLYAHDVATNFEYYFSSVRSFESKGRETVDFSHPQFHRVLGFDAHPIMFPSLAEPIATTEQYLAFAQLTQGMTVLDLGAYSGLTSILFRDAVGESGRVVAVEADERNLPSVQANFSLHRAISGREVELCFGAVWENDGGIDFSSEGSMGASALSLIGGRRGITRRVPSMTLSTLVDRHKLTRVDFIKCDVEGAESVIFRDEGFFASFRPRMIVEVHRVGGRMTTEACTAALARFGYECRIVDQPGSTLPLLECRPPRQAAPPSACG